MANHIITLNQVIKLFNDFVDQHPQLESFGYGQTSEIGTSVKVNYPAMWVTHEQDSNIVVMNRTVIPQMDFTALFFDKINQQPNVLNVSGEASNNGQEILSDTFQMAQDLLGEMVAYWHQYGIGVLENVSAFPIQDEMDDKVNGWGLRFSLKLKHFNCATEIGDVRIQRPMEINYLTCDTLPDCQVIQDIKQDIEDIVVDGGGLTCATLPNCQVIQDIQTDITTNTNDIILINDDIILIKDDIIELKALTGGTTTFDCDMLTGCTIITDIQQDISTNTNNIGQLQGDINFISGETATNTSDISTNTSDISNLNGRVGDNEQDISTAQDDINYISGATSSNSSDISQLQTDIANKLECSDLDGCQTIIDIKDDISTISGSTGGEFTGNTSGNCISDIYVENIYGCTGVTIHSSVQHIGSTASGTLSTAFGVGTTASGMYSHTQGQNTTANAPFSHAQGYGTTASGHHSHAQGLYTEAIGLSSNAQGNYTTASGEASHAEGFMTIASDNHSHAQGNNTTASGKQSHAGGWGASTTSRVIAGGQASFAHFTNFTYTPIGAMAYGSAILGGSNHNIEENAIRSAILGGLNNNIVGGATDSVILGGSNITATEADTVYVPKLNISTVGTSTSINNLGIDANGNVVVATGGGTGGGLTCGELSGCTTIQDIKDDISAISGDTGKFTGNTSANCVGEFHVENIYGCSKLTIHGPIQQNDSTASGLLSTAFGGYTTASGNMSHAQGYDTNAVGQSSHAQGQHTYAIGFASHSGGLGASPTTKVIAGGESSFAHFRNSSGTDMGAMADNSAILGGLNHNIVSGATNSVILGGSGITATEADTVYVPKLVGTNIPAFADEAAAIAGGLVSGAFYQTDGTGDAPLNVAGILMIKQ